MKVDLSIDPKQTTEKIVSFIQKVFKKCRKERGMIGVSGGLDSCLSFALAVKALGKENVYPSTLPYGVLNGERGEGCEKPDSTIKVPDNNLFLYDISPIVDEISEIDTDSDNLRHGNIMTRVRMILLFDRAKK